MRYQFIVLLITAWNTAAIFPDWLVTDINWPAKVYKESGNLILTNGLFTRKFLLTPGLFATIDYYSHEKNSSLLRAINPEAIIQLDGIPYNVGGFLANTTRGYLNRTDLNLKMVPDSSSFQFVGYETKEPEAPYTYTPKRGAPSNIVWPPKGIHLLLKFRAPASAPKAHKNIVVTVHYEIYEGVPVLSKWVSIEVSTNAIDDEGVRAGFMTIEKLSTNWQWSPQGYNWFLVTSDQPHSTPITWQIEPNADSVEPGSFQPMVEASYDSNFSIVIGQDELSLTSFRVLHLLVGSADQERTGLAKRRVTRLLAPQTLENPIFFHLTNTSSPGFRSAVDQLVEVGFEMILYSFWSGFDLESTNKTYMEGLKADIAYANSKGIEVGGYDLISWTRVVEDKWMALKSNGEISDSACFASGWYDELLEKVLHILNYANLTAIETDGPYSGYTCSATNHSHHAGEEDSVYRQNLLQGQFYKTLRERGMFINQPDTYFLQGGNKAAMGYSESQFSLPRWLDLSISRQGMFDDTFNYLPSQGWMFLPLVGYGNGDPAVIFEPLIDNLKEYEWGLAQYMGAGVAACYRGPRVYDVPKTRDVVKKWVTFYKTYRQILNGDLIHVRRGDMQSIDSFLHINSNDRSDPIKGLIFFFNPTGDALDQVLEVPLYYTGLTTTAVLSFEDSLDSQQNFALRRDFVIEVAISLKAQSFTWAVIRGQ